MGSSSKIQWTDATWNPWHGCKKVSTGCKFCYMYRGKERWKKDPTQVLRSKTNFSEPLKWKEQKLIFTCSWSDWFIEEADGWREEAWDIIRQTPHHIYQILTKRPERIIDNLPDDFAKNFNHVWIGVSVENQDMANKRIPELWKLSTLTSNTFVSFEPLIGPIELFEVESLVSNHIAHDITFGWAIIGGESGNETGKYQYRKCRESWIGNLVDECEFLDIPVFTKQVGTFLSKAHGYKHRAGGDESEWKYQRPRQFPKAFSKLKNHPITT